MCSAGGRIAANGRRRAAFPPNPSAAIVAPWNDERLPDHEVAGTVAAFTVVLDRHFHRVLGRLGATGHEPDLAEPFGGELLDDDPGAALDGLGREGVCRRVGQARGLVGERVDHLRHAVADRGHRGRPTAGVDVAVPLVVVEIDPLAAHQGRVRAIQIAMDDARALRVHQVHLSQIVDEERHHLARSLHADGEHPLDVRRAAGSGDQRRKCSTFCQGRALGSTAPHHRVKRRARRWDRSWRVPMSACRSIGLRASARTGAPNLSPQWRDAPC